MVKWQELFLIKTTTNNKKPKNVNYSLCYSLQIFCEIILRSNIFIPISSFSFEIEGFFFVFFFFIIQGMMSPVNENCHLYHIHFP